LQLIGCCGLFIASKLREETIVDPDCYVTASCNLFTRRQLTDKERAIYVNLDWKKIKHGALAGVREALSFFQIREKSPRS
jgi:hypothetical protein